MYKALHCSCEVRKYYYCWHTNTEIEARGR